MSVDMYDGLTTAEAAHRLAAEGSNTVARPRRRRLAARIGHQLADPLVVLLLAAAVVTTLLGDIPDTVVIALVVLVNTAIGVTQEVRADTAIAALDRLAAPTARVVRDGVDTVLPASDVVRGDLIRLEAGDVIPADLTLTDAYRLRVDESALTGESVPVDHQPGDEVSAGTVAVTGRANGIVTRIGTASALGRIATLVASVRPGPTPLQRRLTSLGRALGLTAVALSALVAAFGVAAGRGLAEMAITGVSLVVAAVPESLPAVVTVALALGARRMAATQAVPRRLHAVETLGSVTVVASDKTGTLTEGRMAVQQARTSAGDAFRVTGTGYQPDGEVLTDVGAPAPPDALTHLARAALLCSDAALIPPDQDSPQWRAAGDPLEAAIVAFAARCGLDPHTERATAPRVDEQPFDQATRRMTTVSRLPDGRYLTTCKGAPESVLMPGLVTATEPRRRAAVAMAQDLAGRALRVVAVAAKVSDLPTDPSEPRDLHLLGLLGIGDPIRAGAADIAAAFDQAGIRLILITGDHPATAAAIGARLGLWHDGDEIAHGDAGAPDAAQADRVRVFARTQPDQKLTIVDALQRAGHVVAMTGDGVNDAPALRRADIGVAMGGGTEVARQAAELVLLDDNLATVVSAVREGRRIYDNIRRFLRYGLAGGLAEILVMLAGPFLGLPVPLLPAQILWINLLTHGIPGVALGAEPAEPDTMRRPPRPPQQSILGDGLLRSVLITGGLIAASALAAGIAAARADLPWQTVVFVVLGLAQLGVALAVRARRQAGVPGNPGLLAAVALSGALQVAGVLLPPLRVLLGTDPLSLATLAGCAAVAALPGLIIAAGDRITRRR